MMKVSFWLWLGLAVVSPACAEQAALDPGTLMTMRVDGELTVDTTGKVLSYVVSTPLDPAVKQMVDRAVTTWRFSPVTLDGKPARARTGMRITLAATAVKGGFSVAVDNVTFRNLPGIPDKEQFKDVARTSISQVSMKPPVYPKGLLQTGVIGQVLLYIRLSLDGKPEEIAAYQSTLFNTRGTDKAMKIAREQMEKATLEGARKWRFKVDRTAKAEDIRPSDLTVTVPVVYRFEEDPDAAGTWRVEVRGERADVPWLASEKGLRYAGVSDVDPGDLQPLTSIFKFMDDPVGKAL